MPKPAEYGRNFGYKESKFGADTKGHDVKAYGDTTGKYFFWDASADTFTVAGTLALDGTFSADNIALADTETLTFGTGSDVVIQWDGTNLIIEAAADDSLIEIGDSSAAQKSFDLKIYGNANSGADYLYFDASANLLFTTGIDVQFKDNDLIAFGTGSDGTGDVNITWDSTNLIISAVADDTLIEIGDSAASQLSFDLKWYANENSGASYLYADASENLIYTTGVDVQFKDNDYLVFGTGSDATGDINITWDTSSLLIAGTAASSTAVWGGTSNIINQSHYGDLSTFNNENDATGYTLTARKSRGASDTALQDNDVVLQLTGVGLNDNATPAAKTLANVKILMTDATDTSEDGAITFEAMVAGAAAAEKLRIADVITSSAPINVGVDDTGYDVKFFGATSGCSFLWDESEDQAVITGPADVPALKIVGGGSYDFTTYTALGTAWGDGATPAFVADQGFMKIDLNGTTYRIPLWANA